MASNIQSIEDIHRAALAEGYKDETCPQCSTFFPAECHFIRCNSPATCPMISKSDKRSLLERWTSELAHAASDANETGEGE